jgi:histidinol-phosphate phosphatase family protein
MSGFLVFLDRDGTINEDVGLVYRTKDIRLIPKAALGIKLLNSKGVKIAITTNQPVVARNLCTEEDVKRINGHLLSLLAREGARIDAVYYCPHHPETNHPEANDPKYRCKCECRKPGIGMLKAASERFHIMPSNCFIIGDSTRDIMAGKNFGCTTILLKTDSGGSDDKYDVKPDHICDDLYEAAKLVVRLL